MGAIYGQGFIGHMHQPGYLARWRCHRASMLGAHIFTSSRSPKLQFPVAKSRRSVFNCMIRAVFVQLVT